MTARATDPATSHLAATTILARLPNLRTIWTVALKELGPSTASEVEDWVLRNGGSKKEAESVRKRKKEVETFGLAKVVGQRRCKVTGNQCEILELTNANPSVATIEGKRSTTERREGASDSGRDRQADGDCKAVRSIDRASQSNQAAGEVQTPEAERIAAVVQLISRERDWIDNWRIALDISVTMKAGASWPPGSTDEYVRAMDAAAAEGLIEQQGQKVRAKRVVREVRAVQGSLFE